MPGWNRLARAISCFVSLCCYCCSAFARVGGGPGSQGANWGILGLFWGQVDTIVCVCCHFRAPAHAIFAHNLLRVDVVRNYHTAAAFRWVYLRCYQAEITANAQRHFCVVGKGNSQVLYKKTPNAHTKQNTGNCCVWAIASKSLPILHTALKSDYTSFSCSKSCTQSCVRRCSMA